MQLKKYLFDHYKTQQMCDISILENGGTLKSVSECCKNYKLCDKAAENYRHALEFIPECYEAQKCVIKLLIVKCNEVGFISESFTFN